MNARVRLIRRSNSALIRDRNQMDRIEDVTLSWTISNSVLPSFLPVRHCLLRYFAASRKTSVGSGTRVAFARTTKIRVLGPRLSIERI